MPSLRRWVRIWRRALEIFVGLVRKFLSETFSMRAPSEKTMGKKRERWGAMDCRRPRTAWRGLKSFIIFTDGKSGLEISRRASGRTTARFLRAGGFDSRLFRIRRRIFRARGGRDALRLFVAWFFRCPLCVFRDRRRFCRYFERSSRKLYFSLDPRGVLRDRVPADRRSLGRRR